MINFSASQRHRFVAETNTKNLLLEHVEASIALKNVYFPILLSILVSLIGSCSLNFKYHVYENRIHKLHNQKMRTAESKFINFQL